MYISCAPSFGFDRSSPAWYCDSATGVVGISNGVKMGDRVRVIVGEEKTVGRARLTAGFGGSSGAGEHPTRIKPITSNQLNRKIHTD